MRSTGKTLAHRANEHDEGSWAISYGDMVTLLLAFFMLFFSIDSQEVAKEKLTLALLATLAPLPTVPGELYEQTGEKITVQRALTDIDHTKIERLGEKVVVEFPGVSFFKSGDTDLNAEGQAVLQNFATKYLPFAGTHTLNVIGTTDHHPVSQGRRYLDNLELSALRSISGQRFLSKAGIPLAQTRLGGYGVKKVSEPDGSNNPELDAQSRSIVLVIEPLGGKQ